MWCMQEKKGLRMNYVWHILMHVAIPSFKIMYEYNCFVYVLQEFQEINLSFFWNSAVHEAFKNLEYKGSVVPSTILVGSPIRKHLNVLKTAWSRKMLRSPAGYTIEFLGKKNIFRRITHYHRSYYLKITRWCVMYQICS